MTPLSINQKKLIRGLSRKKIRQETGLFLIEGDKIVSEVLGAAAEGLRCEAEIVVATGDWLKNNVGSIPRGIEICEVKAAELSQLSGLQQPNHVIALARQMKYSIDLQTINDALCLAIETVQDPGNLGTIVRTADWFGVRDIFCSQDSVDLYNPKVIQATMGSFLRVRVHYTDLKELISEIRKFRSKRAGNAHNPGTVSWSVFGTGNRGENLFKASLPDCGMIMLGNESKGLSEGLMGMADRTVTIPHHSSGMHPESLNIASSAAVLCAEFRRQHP